MKYLPTTTILLWVSTVMTYIFAREIILQPFIKFPVFILLSIFLPICFWTLATQNNKSYATVFLGIFTINVAIIGYVTFSQYSFLNSFDPYKETRVDPQLAEILVTGEDEETRNMAGKILYKKFGVSLPFMTEEESYVLYSPTKTDKLAFLENSAINSKLNWTKHRTIYSLDSLLFLLVIHISLFIGLLAALVLRECPKVDLLKGS